MAGQPEGREPAIHATVALCQMDGWVKPSHDVLLMMAGLDQIAPMP